MPSRTSLARIVGFALLLLPAHLADPAHLAADELSDAIEAITGRKEFQQAHWGLLVVDLADGKTLYEHQPRQLFAPASVTKLFSVAAALDALGADHRFETPVYARGKIDDSGVLHGDLVLVASGDLSFGGRTDEQGHIVFRDVDHTYASPTTIAELTEPDPLAGLKDLARQIAAGGVKEVRGEVLIDDRLFEPAQGTGSGPGRLTPIIVNDNLIDLRVTPAQEPGRPALVEWRPRPATIAVDAQVDTTAEKGRLEFYLRAFPHALVLRGSIPVDSPPRVVTYEFDSAAQVARSLLIDCLRGAGVKMAASPLQMLSPPALPRPEEYPSLKRVARHVSPPFRESARLILKVSHNLHASTLPLLLAAREGKRTLNEGMALERKFLAQAGVDVTTISLGGGAGGDRADYVTPRAAVQLLQYMARRDDFDAYRGALPVLGIDGTLAKAVGPKSPARGKIQAKTGTLSWGNRLDGAGLLQSKALAGYADCRSGRTAVFAIFVNLVHLTGGRDTAAVGRTLGELGEVIVERL